MRYFLLFTILMASQLAQGQEASSIDATYCVHNGSVKIRWVASDYDIWNAGNTNGYQIIRFTTYANGTRLSGSALEATKTTIAGSLMPLAENQWDATYPGINIAMAAKNIIYTPDPGINGDDDFEAAIIKKDSEDTRHLFALIAAEQNFDVAKSMALGYEDFTISNAEKYAYFIRINNSPAVYTDVFGAVEVDGTQLTTFEPIQGVYTETLVDQIQIYWNAEPTSYIYSTYDIERSSDGTNFTQVNDNPFLFSGEDEESNMVYFADSVADYNVYYYRIIGRTSFGNQGPPSEVVQGQAKPPRLDLNFNIDSFHITGIDHGELSWYNLKSDWSSFMSGFNIYESDRADGGYTLRNSTPLNNTSRTYDVTDFETYKYFYIEALDYNGYKYRTPAVFAQMPDETPPQVPVNLSGEFVTASTAVIEWDDCPDLDLDGYRVFVANSRTAEFAQVTSLVITDNRYVYEVDPQVMLDTIYIRILATDRRENNSEKSEILALERPDVIPPSQPVLFKATPTPAGIELGWRFSNSDDVTRHIVQRKAQGTSDWTDVLDIAIDMQSDYHENLTPGDITSTCYIDEEILERRTYDYRMLAHDDDDNASSSVVIAVRPYDDGRRGTIDNLGVTVLCEPADTANLPYQAAFDTLIQILRIYESSDTIDFVRLQQLVFFGLIHAEEYNKLILEEPSVIYNYVVDLKIKYWQEYIVAEVQLHWDYAASDQHLQDYQIYRSTGGSALSLYETVRPEDMMGNTYIDTEVKAGRRYLYRMVARHLDGGHSEMSETVTVKVPII